MFERNFPFNQIEKRDDFIFIPNIWVRNEKLPSGATGEDCFAYMISDKAKPNITFTLHLSRTIKSTTQVF